LPGIGMPSSIQFDIHGNYLYIGSEIEIEKNSVYELCKVKLTDFSLDINQNQNNTIVNIVCSDDGNFIATASRDGSVGIYNPNDDEEWKYSTPLILHLPDSCSVTRNASGVAFSDDHKYVLVGYNNGEIYKWPLSADILANLICERSSATSDSVWGKYIDKKNSPIELNRYNCKLVKK
jgi:WD40 repeat protein